MLGLESLEPVRQLRSVASLIREPCDEQRERLDIPGDSQGTGVHRLEADIADQGGSEQLTSTLPDTFPACASTSSILDRCTASRRASAPRPAKGGKR